MPNSAGETPMETSTRSWRPQTRPPCPRRPPGTWPPTCPDPAAPARPTVPNPPLTCTKSSGSTASGTGSSRTTSRSRTNSGGPISRSARTRHPPPPDAGHLRVLVRLGRLVQSATRGFARHSTTGAARRTGPARKEDQPDPTNPTQPAGPKQYAPSEPGSTPGPASNDAGEPGRMHPTTGTPSPDQRRRRKPPA